MSQSFTKQQVLDTDPTLAGSADYIAPSQSAVKSFVDNRLSQVEADDLTDGGDSVLHYHASDRNSANFTGTFWLDLIDGGDSTLHYHATDRNSANFTGTNWIDLVDGGLTTLHTHSASSITTGTMATARLGSGSATAYTFLAGDQTYKRPVVAETNTNDIFRVDNPGGVSAFVGTIATLPGGATLTYNVTSGQEGAMVPTSTSQLGKMRLYNTTRGTSALILNCVTGTNTLTLTANVPAGWIVGDTITIASQTVSGSGISWVDIEITSGVLGKSCIFMRLGVFASVIGNGMYIHPFDASYSASRIAQIEAHTTTVGTRILELIQMTNNVFSLGWTTATTAVIIREAGYVQ